MANPPVALNDAPRVRRVATLGMRRVGVRSARLCRQRVPPVRIGSRGRGGPWRPPTRNIGGRLGSVAPLLRA
jgi:hypothetical protein